MFVVVVIESEFRIQGGTEDFEVTHCLGPYQTEEEAETKAGAFME